MTRGIGASTGTAVLVHGLWGNPDDWRWVREPLESSGWDVVTPDLPSHRSAGAGLVADAEEVRRVVRAARSPVVLVGWSYGGTVIGIAGAGQPAVTRLVYVSAIPEPAGAGAYPAWVRDDDHVLVGDDGTFVLVHEWWLHEEAGATFPADVRNRLLPRRPVSFATSTDPRAAAAWESIPTVVLLGADDELLPTDDQSTATLHDLDVEILACDHFIIFREPHVIVRHVLAGAPSGDSGRATPERTTPRAPRRRPPSRAAPPRPARG